jgi:hypothetical protein
MASDIGAIDRRLWSVADQLPANSELKPRDRASSVDLNGFRFD